MSRDSARPSFTLAELAQRLEVRLDGDGDRRVSGLATLANAGPDQLSFLANPRYGQYLDATAAAAVILQPEWQPRCATNALVTADPYLAFARATHLFDNRPRAVTGVHPRASVAAGVNVPESASIAAGAVIEAGVSLGDAVVVGPNAVIGADSAIGSGTIVGANVTVSHAITIGRDCVLHSGCVIGADGFGFAPLDGGWFRVAQLGSVVLGDAVEVGAGTTIDRGALGDTSVGDGTKIDNLVQIAHNVVIGRNSAIAGCVGIAGSTHIGSNCTLAGGVGVVGHVTLADGVHVTGMTLVSKSIHEPGVYSSGTTMMPSRLWRRNAARFGQLDEMAKRLRSLEKTQRPGNGSDG